MQLIQLFLPVRDNEGTPFPRADYDAVRALLTERFGGVTAFVHSPAVGLWESDEGECFHDEVVLFEVMVDAVDASWWRDYGRQLCRQFCQEEILVRALGAERL